MCIYSKGEDAFVHCTKHPHTHTPPSTHTRTLTKRVQDASVHWKEKTLVRTRKRSRLCAQHQAQDAVQQTCVHSRQGACTQRERERDRERESERARERARERERETESERERERERENADDVLGLTAHADLFFKLFLRRRLGAEDETSVCIDIRLLTNAIATRRLLHTSAAHPRCLSLPFDRMCPL